MNRDELIAFVNAWWHDRVRDQVVATPTDHATDLADSLLARMAEAADA